MLEIAETSKAYTIKPRTYLGRKAFTAISEVVKLAGGHYFSAGKASKFIIPKEQESEQVRGIMDAVIESYHFGRIVIKGREFTTDVVIFPDRVYGSWWRNEGHVLSVDDIKEIIDAEPEVLVVGTGYSGLMKVNQEAKQHLRSSGIELIVAKTGEACEIYNELSRTRRAVAALHLTC